MTQIYVMKALYEKNANDGIEHFTDLSKLASAVLSAQECDATSVRVFRTVEVDFSAYWQSAVIHIGEDLKE